MVIVRCENLRAATPRRCSNSSTLLGWVTRVPGPRPSSPPQWLVNPRCHELYAERAKTEEARRAEVRSIMVGLTKKVST